MARSKPPRVDPVEAVVAQLASEVLATRDRLIKNGWVTGEVPYDAEVRLWIAYRAAASHEDSDGRR